MPDAIRAGKEAHTLSVARMMGLATAATMLGGQDKLSDALGIQGRSLRAKLSAERGVSADDLRSAADALEAHATSITDHARKLRAEAGEIPAIHMEVL